MAPKAKTKKAGIETHIESWSDQYFLKTKAVVERFGDVDVTPPERAPDHRGQHLGRDRVQVGQKIGHWVVVSLATIYRTVSMAANVSTEKFARGAFLTVTLPEAKR